LSATHNGPHHTKEIVMAKFLLLKHYRRNAGPEDLVGVPMQEWSP